jgi:hydrogenase-4 membrane subunit HyfE
MQLPIVVLIVTNLLLLTSRQFQNAVRVLAVQGIFLALQVARADTSLISALIILATNGFIFPALLSRSYSRIGRNAGGEEASAVSFGILIAILSFAGAHTLSRYFGLGLFGSYAISALLTGFILLTTSRSVVFQFAGYLVLQNGMASLIVCVLGSVPLVLELVKTLVVLLSAIAITVAIRQMGKTGNLLTLNDLRSLWG